MDTLTVGLQLPRDMLGTLDVTEPELGDRLKEILALELYREGRITSGKAAELASMSKLDFIRLACAHGLPYFNETPEELSAQVNRVSILLNRHTS
jgi:predicted HTH domain antitoxin